MLKRYTVFNNRTNHTFIVTDNLKKAKHWFHQINRRKKGSIILLDNETGEILKTKGGELYV